MGSGPSNADPRVLAAMAMPPLAPADPQLADLLVDIQRLLRRGFRADSARVLAVPGASRAGIEAVLNSLLEPGDRVLVGVYDPGRAGHSPPSRPSSPASTLPVATLLPDSVRQM
jgi:aspartate aminotransferase-like enzyme